MSRKFAFFVCIMALFALFVASCNNGPEENRAVVTVSSINANNPFFSDVLDQGDTLYVGGVPFTQDDFVKEDLVSVTFFNRPFNSFVTTGPNQPFNDFLITRYRVEWRRVDGGLGVPPVYDGATSILVSSGESTTGDIVLVPFEVKNSPLMSNINYLNAGFPDEILSVATITFWGHEVGTDREWSFTAEVSVDFADPVVKSQKN